MPISIPNISRIVGNRKITVPIFPGYEQIDVIIFPIFPGFWSANLMFSIKLGIRLGWESNEIITSLADVFSVSKAQLGVNH